MSAYKYIVPALAVAGRAAAQSASGGCSVASTTTIQNAADASALASCTTFEGSIAIATGTSGNIDFPGIQRIEGSLTADNATISELSADDLETITDSFSLNELTQLTSLRFPSLTSVDTIEWLGLPSLQGLSFGDEGVQQASSLSIQNTELSSLNGINLEVADSIYIANNPYLSQIQMQLGNISEAITIEANAQSATGGSNGTIVELTNLIWAANMTFINVSTVLIPSLETVNGSLGFYGNSMETISAENLTEVQGGITFNTNSVLSNITMPNLETVEGGLIMTRNPELAEISFPSLTTIGGALDLNGDAIESVELPELERVAGAFNIQSSQDLSDVCPDFADVQGRDNVIRGEFSCAGGQDEPDSAGSLEDGTNDGSGSGSSGGGSSSSSDSADSGAAALYISGTTGLLGVVAAVFGVL